MEKCKGREWEWEREWEGNGNGNGKGMGMESAESQQTCHFTILLCGEIGRQLLKNAVKDKRFKILFRIHRFPALSSYSEPWD